MKNMFILFICLLGLSPLLSAQYGYLKFDGVEGESMDKDHRGWSDILAFSHELQRSSGTMAGSTRRRSSVKMGDLVVTKELDKSTPKLQEAICKGKVYPKVELHLTSNTASGAREPYYQYELKNVMVTSYNVGTSETGIPLEEIALNFEEIKVTYISYDARGMKKGEVEYSWKVTTGK